MIKKKELEQLIFDYISNDNKYGIDFSDKDIENILRLAVMAGADVNATYIDGYTPLHYACQNGYNIEAKLFIELGANVNVLNHNRKTPYDLALENGHKKITNLLEEHGATKKSKNGFTIEMIKTSEMGETKTKYIIKSDCPRQLQSPVIMYQNCELGVITIKDYVYSNLDYGNAPMYFDKLEQAETFIQSLNKLLGE